MDAYVTRDRVKSARSDPRYQITPAAAKVGAGGSRAQRYLNVVVATIGLIVTIPISIVIALLIKLTSRGPIIYTQTRVGLNTRGRSVPGVAQSKRRNNLGGRPFLIYKFRTMRVNAESTSGAVWASQDDNRVTSIGRFLRQYRLDELPQLINVLKGDMNVVGPRPERPEIFAELREAIKDYHLRQSALPGITGHAQINQAYDTSLESVRSKLAFDLEYIERRGFWTDLKIMARTIPVVLFRRGGW
jgi:lipopolysaccharide/colanic/teichoic acid biosynthesis glycosyltransferase